MNRPSGNRPSVSPADLGLTERQVAVLSLLMLGKSNKSICRELDLAPPTVKNHVTAILRALNVTSRTEAVVKASNLGWASPDRWTPQPSAGALPLPDISSIVVLPFANLSGDPDQNYFADGMVDEITIALGRIPLLFVIASNSAFAYKGRAVDAKQIGTELGVRYLLSGSVRKESKLVRIVVQLSDASIGGQIWADRFEGALDNVFELQDRVAATVCAHIAPAIRTVETELARRKPTESLTAYDLYLRALPPHRDTPGQNQESLRLLYKAIELDPAFGAAYGLAAWCHHIQLTFGWQAPPAHWIDEGIRLAHLATEYGGYDPEALWMAGRTLAALAGEMGQALAVIEKSISLNPNSARAWWVSGMTRSYLGQAETALDHFARAHRLNPFDTAGYGHWTGVAMAHLCSGNFEGAKQAVDRALADWPDAPPSLRVKAAVCGLLGRIEEGRECVRRLLEFDPEVTVARFAALNGPQFRDNLKALSDIVEGLRLTGMPA